MLAHFAIPPDESMRTNIGGWLIALVLGGLVKSRSQLIALGVDVRCKKTVLRRSVAAFHFVHRDHWKPEEGVPFHELLLNAEGNDLVIGIVLKVFESNFGKGAVSKKQKFMFLLHRPLRFLNQNIFAPVCHGKVRGLGQQIRVVASGASPQNNTNQHAIVYFACFHGVKAYLRFLVRAGKGLMKLHPFPGVEERFWWGWFWITPVKLSASVGKKLEGLIREAKKVVL